MKSIVRDIRSNINLEENLKLYADKYIALTKSISYSELAIEYFSLVTDFLTEDEENKYKDEIFKGLEFLSECVAGIVENKKIDADSLYEFRKKNINEVYNLTALVDRVNVYERVLNGIEYKFTSDEESIDKFFESYNDESFTKELMRFIVGNDDNSMVNYNISMVISELPIKLTKNKFFEYLSEGINVYKNQPKSGIDSLLYKIKTSAMLVDAKAANEEIDEKINYISNVDIKDMDKAGFEKTSLYIEDVSNYLSKITEIRISMQAVANYLIVLAYNQVKPEGDLELNSFKIIADTLNLYNTKNADGIENVESEFSKLEGFREDNYELLSNYDISDEINEKYGNIITDNSLGEVYNNIYRFSRLISDDNFIDFDEVLDDSEADEKYINEVVSDLENSYNEIFSKCNRQVKHRIMAITLSNLPVFFNNISQLQDFVYDTLSICNNKYEKIGCVNILRQTMDMFK